MACNCGNNKCTGNKCKRCNERDTFQCVPDCKYISCEEVTDWRCVLVNCDGAHIKLNYNNHPGGNVADPQTSNNEDEETEDSALPREILSDQEPQITSSLNIPETVTIPPCITLNALFQLLVAANTPSLQQGVTVGTECAIVIDADIIKQDDKIIVHFNNPPILLATGCVITGYVVEIKHINTNITYTFPVTYSSAGNYILNVVPVGSMSFAPGNTYSIRIQTNTNCGAGINNSCKGLTYYITY